MTPSTRLLLLAGVGALLGACTVKRSAPVQRYALGLARAEYRDYSGAQTSPCDAEPRWLTDELSAVNGLLARFLRETAKAGDLEAVNQEKHLALLQEATDTLEPVLKVHAANLTELRACDFRNTGAFPELARRGTDLVQRAWERLAEAPGIIAAKQLREAQKQWLDQAPVREAEARRTWCAPRPTVGSADLYFAREYPNGRTEWLFCDGHVVESRPGGEPVLVGPEGLSYRERRRVVPKRYLEAARNYPPEEVDRQPGSNTGSAAKGRDSGLATDGPS